MANIYEALTPKKQTIYDRLPRRTKPTAPIMADEDDRAFYERFMSGVSKGTKTNTLGELDWKNLVGTASSDDLSAANKLSQEVGTGKEGWMEMGGLITGQMGEMVAEEGTKALAVGAAAGLATSFTGPGALVAGSLAAGASMPAFMATRAYQQEAGGAFRELSKITDDEGNLLSRDITVPMAHVVGAINGALELFSIGQATKPFKRAIANRIGRTAISILGDRAKTKAFVSGVKAGGISYATEVLTEGIQKGVNLTGGYAGKSIQQEELARYTIDNLKSDVDTVFDEMKQAGKGMWAVSGMGSSIQTLSDVAAVQVKKAPEQKVAPTAEEAPPVEAAEVVKPTEVKPPKLLATVERIQPKLDVVEDINELAGERESLIQGLGKDKIIDKATRYEMIEGLRAAETAEEMQLVVDGMREQLQTAQKRTELRGVVKEKKFQRVENLRKAMELPTVKRMDKKQIGGFIETLSQYEENDVFLTQRQIETVDSTELAGMRTLREARNALSDKLNVPVADLQNIKVSSLDRLRYDTALARKNPFYKMLVEDYYAETLESEASYLEREETTNELTKKARKSRKRTIGERFIPTDKRVFAYLESDKKEQLAKDMTREELALAEHLQEEFSGALEHLIKIRALETGRENYITNVRRDFLEAWKESGIKSAIKEMFDQQKMDEQTFDILDQKTGDILPLEKFFQFAMKRSGGLNPSQNVAKASATYFKAFEKKRALDQFMPKMMVFVDAVASDRKTSTGLEADQQLKNFVKEWINTKKGRPTKLLLKPGGKLDIVTKTAKMFITLMDLGFNIPVGAAATVGETVANYVNMGKKKTVIGASRFATKKGRAIVKKHKNYIGKSVWSLLSEPSAGVLDKTTTAMLAFFTESARNANKMFLLGSLTKEEFESGNVSKERLAELKIEMGRWRTYAGAKSILGSTTEVGLFTQYKSWAIPILSSTASNIKKLVKSVYSKEARGELTMRDVRELGAAIEVTAAALTAISMMEDDDDDTFEGQLTAKIKREALTILGALDPTFYASEPRMIQFAAQVADITKDLVTLEEYSKRGPKDVRGKLKAVEKAKRLVIPRAIKQFTK